MKVVVSSECCCLHFDERRKEVKLERKSWSGYDEDVKDLLVFRHYIQEKGSLPVSFYFYFLFFHIFQERVVLTCLSICEIRRCGEWVKRSPAQLFSSMILTLFRVLFEMREFRVQCEEGLLVLNAEIAFIHSAIFWVFYFLILYVKVYLIQQFFSVLY